MAKRDHEDIRRLFPIDRAIQFRPEHTSLISQRAIDIDRIEFVKTWTPLAGPSAIVLIQQMRDAAWKTDFGCAFTYDELARMIGASPDAHQRVATALGRACRYSLASIGVDETDGFPQPYVRIDYQVGAPRVKAATR